VSISVYIGGINMFKNEIKIKPPTINPNTINNCNKILGILILQVKWAFYQRMPVGYVLHGAIFIILFWKSIYYGIYLQQLHKRW
jgi:hypothetical protein